MKENTNSDVETCCHLPSRIIMRMQDNMVLLTFLLAMTILSRLG